MSVATGPPVDEYGNELPSAHSQAGRWAMVPMWVLPLLTGTELQVYVALRSFADRRGEAHPFVRTISQVAGVSVRTVEKAISRMRVLGVLSSERLTRKDGTNGGCRYFLRDIPPTQERGGYPSSGTGTKPSSGTGQRTHQLVTHQ